MHTSPVLVSLLVLAGAPVRAQNRVLTHREQASLQRNWIEKRFNTVLPALMRAEGIDMWLVVSREYNDDPVFRSMSPATTYASRRRTILAFADHGGTRGVECVSIGRFDYDGLFRVEKTHNDGQWEGLRRYVEQIDPDVIGINSSEMFSHADGLSANEKDNLTKALGPKYSARLKSAEGLVVGWLETKLPEETDAYRNAVAVAHQVIREAFSSKVIVPGVTTGQDVAWWMRQRVAEMGLGQWFHPGITIFRRGDPGEGMGGARVIERGDMLHCDFGIVYMGFATDTQHNAYVLLPGEADAPAGLKEGLAAANRLQDLTMRNAKVGTTGNAALAATLAQARAEGLSPSVYCHPVGYHGHGAGPLIGMTDYQNGVPGRGEYRFRPNSWHSIELNVTHPVKEWNGQAVRFALEEDAVLLDDGWHWIAPRQTNFYLIH
jgi:Xaa-Pro aminopeptidase